MRDSNFHQFDGIAGQTMMTDRDQIHRTPKSIGQPAVFAGHRSPNVSCGITLRQPESQQNVPHTKSKKETRYQAADAMLVSPCAHHDRVECCRTVDEH